MTQRDKILMCPPDFFTVENAINPWMAGNEGQLDRNRAQQQWEALVGRIGEFADVVTIDPQPDLPDMVFTANAGAVYGNKAIASHFMPHERRPEEQHFKRWFSENGLSCSTSTTRSASRVQAIAWWTAVARGSGPDTGFARKLRRTRRLRNTLAVNLCPSG